MHADIKKTSSKMMFSFTTFSRCQRHVNNPILTLLRNLHKEVKEQIPVAWEKPEIGWTKLNFDGSCKGRAGKGSNGGIFRNHKAELLLGYAESIGRTSSTIAELAALRRGLGLVLENGWNDNIWLEGNAKTLVDIIVERRQVRCSEVQRHVSDIISIIPEFDNCIVTHIYIGKATELLIDLHNSVINGRSLRFGDTFLLINFYKLCVKMQRARLFFVEDEKNLY